MAENPMMDARPLAALTQRVAASLADDIALALAEYVAAAAKESMGTGASGRAHTASAAGQPPAVDTGALQASIRAQAAGHGAATVTDGVPYGIHLEFGTRRMAARPFMLPAVEEMRREVETLVRGVTDEVFS